MSIWTENLQFLKLNALKLYQTVTGEAQDEGLEVSLDSARRIVRVKKAGLDISLGSSINPKREAERILADCNERAGFVVLMGSGNLKLLDAVKRKFKYITRLIIVEPSLAIFTALLKTIPLKSIFSAFPTTNITILLAAEFDTIDNHYKVFTTTNPIEDSALILPVAYRQMFPVHATKLKKLLMETNHQINSGRLTRRYFRYLWHINEWRNLSANSAQQESLRGLMSKLPVIIVGAGPSLNKNVHLLREVGDRALVIAVGSGIRVLHKNGIIPHLRISLEATSLQQRLFAGIDPTECPLVYTNCMSRSEVQMYDNNLVEALPVLSHTIKSYLFAKLRVALNSVSSGSSVTNLALFLTEAFGAQKVILLGQDLCGSIDKNYAEGSWTTTKDNKALMDYTDKVKTKNIYGEDVYTDSGYYSIKTLFEYTAQRASRIHFINATEGGLNIVGFENKRLIDVLADDLPLEPPMDIKGYLKTAIEEGAKNRKEQAKALHLVCDGYYLKELDAAQRSLDALDELAGRGMEDKYVERITRQIEKLMDMPIYECIGAGFVKDARRLKDSLAGDSILKRRRAADEYIGELKKYIAFSREMAQEFLSGEQKLKIVSQS